MEHFKLKRFYQVPSFSKVSSSRRHFRNYESLCVHYGRAVAKIKQFEKILENLMWEIWPQMEGKPQGLKRFWPREFQYLNARLLEDMVNFPRSETIWSTKHNKAKFRLRPTQNGQSFKVPRLAIMQTSHSFASIIEMKTAILFSFTL